MVISQQIDGFKITKKFFSRTIEQEFSPGTYKGNAAVAMVCVPHVSFSIDKNRKIVALLFDWGFVLKGYVEFFVEDRYYIDYSTYENEKELIDKLVSFTKGRFVEHLNKESPRPIVLDIEDFHGTAKDILLRDQVLAAIHSRD